MPNYKKPIRRSMLKIGLTFVALMIILNGLQSTGMIRMSVQRRYDAMLRHAITHVEDSLDLEDLEQCMKTGVESEKYQALREELNLMVDDFHLVYLYICIPVDDGRGTMTYVVSSLSQAERGMGITEDWPLMYTSNEFFTPEQIVPYLKAWEKSPEISHFETTSVFGPAHTACKPLVNAEGKTIALLGADISTEVMRRQISTYALTSIGLILLISFLFALNVALWLKKTVTEPLGTLERNARGFANRISGKRDPELLVFDAAHFRENNEIQWVSDAIEMMSEDMKDYVEGALSAEKRAEKAEEEASEISKAAYEDAMTNLKSKVAFDAKKAALAGEIARGDAEFAVIVVNLNHLMQINNTYGLDCGSKYIVSASRLVSDIFGETPVYRVEGDEFVVLLEGEDYRKRYELFNEVEERFRSAQSDMSRNLWERCSAAAGMAEFTPDADTDVDQVRRRAENIMLRNKRMMRNDASRTDAEDREVKE